MRLKTILNYGLKFKCFCIGKSEFNEKKDSIIVEIKARTNSKPVCSICGTASPGYDTLPERLFEFVPMWGLRVFFRYAMRRVSCPQCKRVVVEAVPWCDGKNHFTNHYAAFLASWAKELDSWKSVAAHFHTSWQTVCSAVESVVNYGLTHRNLDSVTALGVDEIAWHKGHKYLTLVYQINPGCDPVIPDAYPNRIKALCLLGRLGDPKAIPPLRELVLDYARNFTADLPLNGKIRKTQEQYRFDALSFALFSLVALLRRYPDPSVRDSLLAWQKRPFVLRAGRNQYDCAPMLKRIPDLLA